MSRALVVTRVDVNIKNISNKNTISVIEDILKLGFILFSDFKNINYSFDHKLNPKTLSQ